MTENSYQFRTKLGFCTIDDEKLSLTRNGMIENVADKSNGPSINQWLFFYGLIGIVFLALGIKSLMDAGYVPGTLYLLLACVFIWNVITSRNNSGINVISRDEIYEITIHKPRPPLTRGYFIVHFRRDGKNLKRLIMLPGSMNGGKEEFKKALDVFRNSGLESFVR